MKASTLALLMKKGVVTGKLNVLTNCEYRHSESPDAQLETNEGDAAVAEIERDKVG